DVLRCARRLASTPSKNDQTLTLAMPKRRDGAAVLVVAPGTPDEQRIEIGSTPLTIGTDPDARVRVGDPHVSRRHAEVARVGATVVVRDLESRNGTYVDGIAVKEAILHDRATIRIGATTIRFETEAQAPGPTGPKRIGDAIGSS